MRYRQRMASSSIAGTKSSAIPLAATAATSFGFLLVQLDVSIVNIALARMDEGLGAGMTGLQWIVDAYSLTFASFLLLAGSLSDRVGARRIFVAGFAIFMAASLGCGLAPGLDFLIGARLLQGGGAALMVPSSLALLNHACAGDAATRHRAVGLWTAAGSVGLALGPIAGGLLIGAAGWRSIFLVNLPIGALGLWLTLRSVKEAPAGRGHLDLGGQVIGIVMLFSLVGAAIEAGERGWTSPLVLGCLGLSASALAALLLIETRARHPMLPLPFFREPAFCVSLVIGIAINFTVYGTLFLMSLVLQKARGYGPAETGLVFLPCTITVGIANVWAGYAAARHGTRRLMMAGLLGGACSYALLLASLPDGPVLVICLALALMGAAIGTAVPAMTSALLEAVPRERGGVASGILNTARQAAGAMGVAIFGALLGSDSPGGAEAAMIVAITLSLAGAATILVATAWKPRWARS